MSRHRHSSQYTIVIAFAEALAAPEVAWSLTDAGFHVIGIARKGHRSAIRHSKYVECYDVCPPESNMEQSIRELQAILTSQKRESPVATLLLMPLDDTAVWVFNKLDLSGGWLLAGPKQRLAEIALNKKLQIDLAQQAGFNVPRTGMAKTAEELITLAVQTGFPVILKPVECVLLNDGRKLSGKQWVCANTEELQTAAQQWNERFPLILQKYILGMGEGIFGIAAPEGVRAWSAHRRLRMMNPHGSGSSACVSQQVAPELKPKVERLVEVAEWRGLFMVELLREHCGTVWFVEFNGRPWGSIALARDQGLEYPAWSVQLVLDEHCRAGIDSSVSPGLVCRNIGRELMHLLFVMRGPKSSALVEWPLLSKSLASVLRIRTTDRFYNWRRDDRKVFFADCYYTVRQNVLKGRD